MKALFIILGLCTIGSTAYATDCKMMVGVSLEKFVKDYLSELERRQYFEPVVSAIQAKGYTIANDANEETPFVLGISGNTSPGKSSGDCKEPIPSTIPLTLWQDNRPVKIVVGSYSTNLSCEEVSVAIRKKQTEEAELKSRSQAVLDAIKELPDCH